MIAIKPISAADTLPLRAKVLKPYLRPQDCTNPGDEDPLTLHLGAFLAGELVGIATFLQEPHHIFPESRLPYRLRGMATDPSFHRRGIGSQLVLEGEQILRQRGCDLMWFNAREKAFLFYQSLGYEFKGEMFDIDRIGPHKVMYKAFAHL